ncbi:hypothetical protein Dimus_010448 [Dionaea muscipula]
MTSKMYAKYGEVGATRDLFNQLPKKDRIAWSAVISAYAQSGHPSDAFYMFEQMKLTKQRCSQTRLLLLVYCKHVL